MTGFRILVLTLATCSERTEPSRSTHGPCPVLPRRLRVQTRQALHFTDSTRNHGLSIAGVSLVAVGMDPDAVVTQRALSQLLARSGRHLSAETERCLRVALEQHQAAMRSHSEAMRGQRQTRNILEELLDREDDGGMADASERARRQF